MSPSISYEPFVLLFGICLKSCNKVAKHQTGINLCVYTNYSATWVRLIQAVVYNPLFILFCSPVAYFSLPVKAKCKVVAVAVGIGVWCHISAYILLLSIYCKHILRELHW